MLGRRSVFYDDLQQKEILDKNRKAREYRDNVRDIGPPPKIKDPARREACKDDLREFLLVYSPETFPLRFSPDHEDLIDKTRLVLTDNGRFVCAMPRGSGKTSIFQRAIIWAILYGHRRYPMLLCADDAKFKVLLKGIRTIFETSDLLYADFPEVVYPVRCLERSATRAMYQLCDTEPTFIQWGTTQILLPTTQWTRERGNAASAMGGGGLTGAAIRGSVITTPDGEMRRPDAVLIDDPQTRKTAKSEVQCQEREDVIKGDILGMAGPGKTVAAMVACTVIYRDDLAERLLDRERSPQWDSLRVSMIKSWPKNIQRWEQYHEVRRKELLGELPPKAATQFYQDNRADMDDGAAVYWEDRIEEGYASALESAMAEYFEDPRSFMAEKQNTPEEDIGGDIVPLSSLELVKRVTVYRRQRVPAQCEKLTCHVDVQQRLLYYSIIAWTNDFGGYIIDYGTWPEQSRRSFNYRDVRKTLQRVHTDHDNDGALRFGIKDCITHFAGTAFQREDGATLQIDLGLVDSRYKPELVEESLIEAGFSNWMPAWGVGIGAKDMPLKLRTNIGSLGHYYVVQKPKERRLRSIFVDTNYWKSEAYLGWSVPPGHSHALTLYKGQPSHHQLFCDHQCAERATRVEARGRTIDEWDLPPSKPDNHWWDTVVGNYVAASVLGIKKHYETHGQQPTDYRRKRTVKQ